MGGQGNLFQGFREKSRLSKRSPKELRRDERRFFKDDEQRRKKVKRDEQAK